MRLAIILGSMLIVQAIEGVDIDILYPKDENIGLVLVIVFFAMADMIDLCKK